SVRPPFIRQDGYFTPNEITWLRAAYERPEVQTELARRRTDAPVKKAANVLTGLFRTEITGPGPAETEADFQKRLIRARKADRDGLSRKTETQEAFTERMKDLPDKLYNWLTNWKGSLARKGPSAPWTGPPIPSIPTPRQDRKKSGLDIFQQSGNAPKVPVVNGNGRTRADVAEWRRQSKIAWDRLSAEARQEYESVAEALNSARALEAENADSGESEKPDSDGDDDDGDQESNKPAPRAEDVAHWIDVLMEALYKNAKWAGYVCVAGADEKGEKATGVNRYGLSFQEALLQAVGWTREEFDLILYTWVQQSVTATQNPEERAWQVLATQALIRTSDLIR
ncbi:hypothetical protein LXA43DRAFT_866149, partial [Ganoderma leucocontextum]